jgi:hypothetical protein
MTVLTSMQADEIRQRGSIRDSDVARLSAACDEAADFTVGDAEALFSLHGATPIQAPAWGPFFVSTIADFIVHQARPEGYVVAENARWLADQISVFGRVETSIELGLLVHVIETARWTPPSLAAFGLAQIRHAVETGAGPLRAGRNAEPGTITPDEVELAGRLIAAFGGETSIAVTRTEADALIDINRAIARGRSSPAWSTLFVKAIGTAVLSALGHSVPTRREILEAATKGEDAPELLAMMLGEAGRDTAPMPAVANSSGMTVWHTSPILTPEERALTRLERQRLEIVTNEVIEEATDVWLMTRLSTPAPDEENERALLAFILREAGRLPRELAQFAARRAIAA